MNIDKALQESKERLAIIMRESEKEYDPAMLRAYERYEKAEHDYISGINGAHSKGLREGELRGHSKGLREGQQEIAKKALVEGASIEFISKITGLDADSIKKL